MIECFEALMSVLRERKANPRLESYTSRLLSAGEDEIAKKIGEEVIEIILAAKGQGDARLIEEMADLVYHLSVLLVTRDLSWHDVHQELAVRAGDD